jgi:hypothetical protein
MKDFPKPPRVPSKKKLVKKSLDFEVDKENKQPPIEKVKCDKG